MGPLKVAEKADQVEFSALNNYYAAVGDGLDDEFISGEIEDLVGVERQTGDEEDWPTLDSYHDSHQGRILQELEARSRLLENTYPFTLVRSSLTYKQIENGAKIYETLLLTSLTTRRQGSDWSALTDSFERLSALAVKRFFQCDEVWWTGANSDQGFKELVEAIHEATGELEWNPDPNIYGQAGYIKDAGLDFVNYRRLDRRPGGLFFFGQSACGKDWYSKTQLDLRSNKLERIFRMPYANPVNLFTIPYLITNDDEKMARAATNFTGLIFDRARLTEVLSGMQGNATVRREIQTVHDLASNKCN